MSLKIIETGLILDKSAIIRMASNIFITNKRVTEIGIRSYNMLIKTSYKGQRKNLDKIRTDLLIESIKPMEERECA